MKSNELNLQRSRVGNLEHDEPTEKGAHILDEYVTAERRYD